jgi:hypothetical protein
MRADVMSELKGLRLHGMAQAWGELEAQGDGAGLQASRWLLEHLLRAEHVERHMRSVAHQMKSARFPLHRDLAGFDFEGTSVDQTLIKQLADLSFAEQAHNAVLIGKHAAPRGDAAQSSVGWRHAAPVGLTLYPEDALEGVDVQVGFSQQLLELGVLALKLPQALGFRDLHAAVFGAPFVKRGLAEAATAAQLRDGHACFGLPQEANDLFFAESGVSSFSVQ